MEADMGPLQLLVVGFEHTTLDGSVLVELQRLNDAGAVRIVDLLAVTKQDGGDLIALEHTDLPLEEKMTYAAWVGGLVGLGMGGVEGLEIGAFEGMLLAESEYEYGLDEEAIQTIGADIPEGGAALVAVLEHRWAIPLRNAIRAQGGIAIAQDFLNPESLIAMGLVAGAELVD
jgi:uncharacterized membrane protein